MDLTKLGIAAIAVSAGVFLASRTTATAIGEYEAHPLTAQVKDDSASLSLADAKKLKSPIAFTRKSITRGQTIFQRSCTACHGKDGKAMMDVVADATDLTSPKLWRNGTSEGEIFRSIRDGAGVGMPPFKFEIHQEEDIWHLVNYVRSLWPESMRPQLQEDAASSTKEGLNNEREN